MTVEGQRNRDLALSLSKGGRGFQACFDKLSTGLQCWASEATSSAAPVNASAVQPACA